jgi:hypothetical protein
MIIRGRTRNPFVSDRAGQPKEPIMAVAAGSVIYAARYVKQTSTAINQATHAQINPTTVSRTDPGGAGDPGDREHLVTKKGLGVTIFGNDYTALLALVGSAAANIVIGTYGAAGALEKLTVKNVKFVGVPQAIDIPENDAGGKIGKFAIHGDCEWANSDTFATMLVAAADGA